MSTRNLVWLVLIAFSVLVGWALAGWGVGAVAGLVTLVVSEVVERTRRRRRRSSAAGTSALRDVVERRR